jgi:hypothetical protein
MADAVSRRLRSHGKHRQLLFQLRASTRGTFQLGVLAHQQLEAVVAGRAAIFVERHTVENSRFPGSFNGRQAHNSRKTRVFCRVYVPVEVGRVFAEAPGTRCTDPEDAAPMKDWLHLIRLSGLLGAAAFAFLVVRPFFIPESFGDIGHYRADAVGEAQALPMQYAERASCETCHGDVVALRVETQSRHAAISCQSCHGPLAAHAASGGEPKPPLPDVVPLCSRCHEATAGRPKFIPQVNPAEHSGGETCSTCHLPHAPGVS